MGWLHRQGRVLRCGGFVQGGLLTAMLDATTSAAVFAMTHGKLYPPTISRTVNFLGPAKPGPIIGEAKVTQLGRSIAFMEGRLTVGDGTLLATALRLARDNMPDASSLSVTVDCRAGSGVSRAIGCSPSGYDRDGRGRRLRRTCRGIAAASHQHGHRPVDQLGGQFGNRLN
jgi:uncharacterized protein (TIGR00369 family)